MMRNAVIVAAARTAVGKAPKGTLRSLRPDDMAAAVVQAIVERSGIDPAEIEDLVLGCAFPEAEQGMNVARIVALRAGLPETVCGHDGQPLLLQRLADDCDGCRTTLLLTGPMSSLPVARKRCRVWFP